MPKRSALRVGRPAAVADRELEVIELRLAVAVRPPQARLVHVQLRELRRREAHFGLPGRDRRGLAESHAFEARASTVTSTRRDVRAIYRHQDGHVGAVGARQRQPGDHLRIEHPHAAGSRRAPRPARCRCCDRECRESSPSLRRRRTSDRRAPPSRRSRRGRPRWIPRAGCRDAAAATRARRSRCVCPARRGPVTSNTPRMNAPRMLPSRLPLIHTSAA